MSNERNHPLVVVWLQLSLKTRLYVGFRLILPFILAFIALFLVYLEFFMPGRLFAIAGAAAAISAIFFLSVSGVGVLWVILFSISLVVGVVYTISLALKNLRLSGKKNHALSKGNKEGETSLDSELIGQIGIVLTDLKPVGHVIVGERRLQAFSESGYISSGQQVLILRADGAHYVVVPSISI